MQIHYLYLVFYLSLITSHAKGYEYTEYEDNYYYESTEEDSDVIHEEDQEYQYDYEEDYSTCDRVLKSNIE